MQERIRSTSSRKFLWAAPSSTEAMRAMLLLGASSSYGSIGAAWVVAQCP